MPLALPATPRKMFPPPTTTAIWTPVAAASATSSATSLILCVSIPEDSDPSNASPLSLRSTLLYSESPALTQPPPLLNRTPTDEPGPQPPPKKGRHCRVALGAIMLPLRAGNERTCRFLCSPQCGRSYTHLRAHETVLDLVCRLLLEKK